MWGLGDTHPDLLPCHLVEEDVTALFLLDAHLDGFGQRDVFGEPHFEVDVESPVAVCSFLIETVQYEAGWEIHIQSWDLQFTGDEFLQYVSRLGEEDPEEGFVGETRNLFPDVVDVVDGVTFW